MTNGGLDTIRSNVSSSRTGSNSEPSRRSAAGAPDRARVSAVMCRARGLRSVAVTRVACRAACSAWIPEPVPRSRAAETGVRTVIPASVVDAPPTPRTTPSALLPIPCGPADGAAQVGHDEPVLAVRAAEGPDVDGGGDVVLARARQPAGLHARVHGQHVLHARVGNRLLEQEETDKDLQWRVPAGRAQRHGLAAREGRVRGGAEQVEETVGGEGGREQGLAQPGGDVRVAAWRAGGTGWRYSRPHCVPP